MAQSISKLSYLIQFSDSAFPVGTFSFSNGLETAAYEGLVHDAKSLEEYARSAALQGAYTDGVCALLAFRASKKKKFDEIVRIDKALNMVKMNDEARLMLTRMGKKMAELIVRLFPSELSSRFLDEVNAENIPGCFPIVQGLAFAEAGLDERSLFASHQYGIVNMILGAALRIVRVSHYDTQEILYRLGAEADELYDKVKEMTLEEIHCFVPEMDIMASMHEKGSMRMFMS